LFDDTNSSTTIEDATATLSGNIILRPPGESSEAAALSGTVTGELVLSSEHEQLPDLQFEFYHPGGWMPFPREEALSWIVTPAFTGSFEFLPNSIEITASVGLNEPVTLLNGAITLRPLDLNPSEGPTLTVKYKTNSSSEGVLQVIEGGLVKTYETYDELEWSLRGNICLQLSARASSTCFPVGLEQVEDAAGVYTIAGSDERGDIRPMSFLGESWANRLVILANQDNPLSLVLELDLTQSDSDAECRRDAVAECFDSRISMQMAATVRVDLNGDGSGSELAMHATGTIKTSEPYGIEGAFIVATPSFSSVIGSSIGNEDFGIQLRVQLWFSPTTLHPWRWMCWAQRAKLTRVCRSFGRAMRGGLSGVRKTSRPRLRSNSVKMKGFTLKGCCGD